MRTGLERIAGSIVNQLPKRLVREIRRRASVRAAHREVRGYSTLWVRFPWATHPYIPMKRGFVYLFVVMDWASRRVLSWRLSNTLSTDFCIEAVQEALIYGTPEIFNTDQGSQFPSMEFTELLKEEHIAISMDGRGCWRDNVFLERLWKSIKYEEVYLHAYDSVSEARRGLEHYLTFYNQRRPHSTLDGSTPDEVYFGCRECLPDAA